MNYEPAIELMKNVAELLGAEYDDGRKEIKYKGEYIFIYNNENLDIRFSCSAVTLYSEELFLTLEEVADLILEGFSFIDERQKLISDIAKLLGAEADEENSRYSSHAYIKINGGQLPFKFGGWRASEKGKIIIGGQYVKAIKVSDNKSPEQIAKDIKKRILPAFLAGVKATQEREKEAREYRANKEVFQQEMAESLGKADINYDGSFSFYGPKTGRDYLRAKVNVLNCDDRTCSFELDNISAETAIKLIEFLKAEHQIK